MPETPVYSVVIPVYCSGEWLDELVQRIHSAMAKYTCGFELILVNDASPDEYTWQAIERNAERHPWVHGFDMLYNVGQFRATLCGLEQARGRYVVTMDDDLQHPPEELPKLIAALNERPRADCIFGIYERKKHGSIRNLGSRLYAWLNHRMYGGPPGIKTSSFRVMTSQLAQALVATRMGRPMIGPMVLHLTPKVRNVSIRHEARPHGTSGYTFGKCITATLQNVVNGSLFPLRLFAVVGLVASGLAFVLAAYFFLRKLTVGIGVGGYASLIVTLSFFSGLILAAIGVLGEYIARMIQEVSGPPRYMICRTTRPAASEAVVKTQA